MSRWPCFLRINLIDDRQTSRAGLSSLFSSLSLNWACPFLRIETLSAAYISGSELVVLLLVGGPLLFSFLMKSISSIGLFVVDLPSEFLYSVFFIHCQPLLINVSAGGREVNRQRLVLGNVLLQGRCGGLVIAVETQLCECKQ